MTALHETDFYAWTQQQAAVLKSGQLAALDVDYLLEELECMGASEKRELKSRLSVLIAHLLKWRYQPKRCGKSWQLTIDLQRAEVLDVLETNPSLKPLLPEIFIKAYKIAILHAAKETKLPKNTFPDEPPFSLGECLDDGFFPETYSQDKNTV